MATIRNKLVREQLFKAHAYISQDSLQNARIVINDIIDITINLTEHPDK